MNFWTEKPDRDEVLDRIFDFFKLLSEEKPEEAEKLVNVGSMDKFRDTLHYYLTDYSVMVCDDDELMALPDDLSLAVTDPYQMPEEELSPTFTGNQLKLVANERIEMRIPFMKEITPYWICFQIFEHQGKYLLNLMQVRKE